MTWNALAQTNIPNGVGDELDPRSMGNWEEPQNHPKMVGMCRNQLEHYGRNTAYGFSAMRLTRPLSPAEFLPRQGVGNDSPSKRGENPKKIDSQVDRKVIYHYFSEILLFYLFEAAYHFY